MIRRSLIMMHRARVARLLLFAGTAVLIACTQTQEGQPPVYPVKGIVLYQGKPITGGTVVFERDGGEPADPTSPQASGPLRATGRIEADGSFGLRAFPGAEGVPEGQYKVGISSVPPRSEGNLLDAAASAKRGNPDVLRGRYSDPRTSGLRARVVKDQDNRPRFDLK
jgi:hypothetical protein